MDHLKWIIDSAALLCWDGFAECIIPTWCTFCFVPLGAGCGCNVPCLASPVSVQDSPGFPSSSSSRIPVSRVCRERLWPGPGVCRAGQGTVLSCHTDCEDHTQPGPGHRDTDTALSQAFRASDMCQAFIELLCVCFVYWIPPFLKVKPFALHKDYRR